MLIWPDWGANAAQAGWTDFLDPVSWVVSGGGGGVTSEHAPDVSGNDDQYGFMDLTLTKEELTIEAISHSGAIRRKMAIGHVWNHTSTTTTSTTSQTTSTTTTSTTYGLMTWLEWKTGVEGLLEREVPARDDEDVEVSLNATRVGLNANDEQEEVDLNATRVGQNATDEDQDKEVSAKSE
jgi:hypothetical protein